MGKPLSPRHGSMQYWPRKRASSENVRLRSRTQRPSKSGDVKIQGFAGYKAGMTHVMFTDGGKNSITKGETVASPVTIIECPPVTVIGARGYATRDNGYNPTATVYAQKLPVEVKRALAKKDGAPDLKKLEGSDEVRIIIATQPQACGFGKKVADIFELSLSGDVASQITFITEHLGKTIAAADVLQPGDLVDAHAVTKGKGFQGSVKRFGVNLTSHKSEKARRGPGSLGGWKGHMHFMYRLAMAGQVGYHQRTEYNKAIVMLSDKPEEVNPVSGIRGYGVLKSSFVLIKGSVGGAKKRLIKFTPAIRPNKKLAGFAPSIESISTEAQN